MTERYIRARFFMLCGRVAAPFQPQVVQPGEAFVPATKDQIEDRSHDEELVVNTMLDKSSEEAPELYDQIRPHLRTPQLRDAPAEIVKNLFVGFR